MSIISSNKMVVWSQINFSLRPEYWSLCAKN